MNRDITIIQADINRQLKDPAVAKSLLETTFKGLSDLNMKKAITEGVIRGFDFKDFLEKNVYAIKYGDGYALVTSIDHNRKIGAKSGIVGTDAPVYAMTEGRTPAGIPQPESATVTVHKIDRASGHIGDFTATVYFDEYYKEGKSWDGEYKPSMWDTKPRTMIAKVAEMHALRKACPEELAQSFVEEEFRDDKKETAPFDVEPHRNRLNEVKTLEELKTVWASMPIQAKQDESIIKFKDELKTKLTPVEGDVTPTEEAA